METVEVQKRKSGLLALGLLVIMASAINFLLSAPWPLTGLVGSLDDGVYALGGAEWAQGRIPYRDFWDNKPPSIYVLNLAAWKLSGGLNGIWLLSLGCSIGTAFLFYDVCRRMYGEQPARLSSVFFFCAMLPFAVPNMVNSFVVLLALVSLRIVLHQPKTAAGLAGAGLAIGLLWGFSFLLRPNAVLLQSVVSLLLVFAVATRFGWRMAAAVLACEALGALAYVGPVLGYFWAHDAIPDLLDCLGRFNASYVSGRSTEQAKTLLFGIGVSSGGNVFLLAGAAAWIMLHPQPRANLALRLPERSLVLLLLLELVLGSASGRPFNHYFEPAILAGSLVVCAMFARMADSGAAPFGRLGPRARSAALASLYVALAAPSLVWFAQTHGATLATKGFWFNRPVVDMRDYLQRHGNMSRVFVWGNRPGVYLLPGVSSDVRFSFVLPFLIPNYVNDGLVRSLLADLDRQKPDVIFDLSPSEAVPPLSSFVLGRVPGASSWETWQVTQPLSALYSYVSRNYRPEKPPEGQMFIAYRRMEPP